MKDVRLGEIFAQVRDSCEILTYFFAHTAETTLLTGGGCASTCISVASKARLSSGWGAIMSGG